MTPVRILVATREGSLAADVTRLLTDLGHTIAATTGCAAGTRRLAEQLRPDLALIDIRLPGPPDSVALISQLRNAAGLPVVFLVPAGATSLDPTLVAAPSAVVAVPVDAAQLRVAVESALARHRVED